MATIGTLLSGGECVGVGARDAGLTHLWGFEIEDDIAQVARDNDFNVITANVLELDPHTLETPTVLHVSTVCKRASGANQSAELNEDGTKEAPEDIAMGEKVAQFIDVMTPKVFTLENVYAYRNFKAFKIICAALNRNGYMWDFDNLNSADFGVPQTRRRLILRAIRGSLLPMLPQPVKWVGWYEAILDLIPTLPDSQFAPWQMARLPELMKTFLINGGGNTNFSEAYPGRGCREEAEPSHTVTTVTANGGNFPKAFIVDQLNYHKDGTRNPTIRTANEPVWTIPIHSTKHPTPRAFVVGSHYGQPKTVSDRRVQTWFAHEPYFSVTVSSANHHDARAWLACGRIVEMDIRALARFQSIPDSYTNINPTIVGNGVPPLLYKNIIGALMT